MYSKLIKGHENYLWSKFIYPDFIELLNDHRLDIEGSDLKPDDFEAFWVCHGNVIGMLFELKKSSQHKDGHIVEHGMGVRLFPSRKSGLSDVLW